MSGYKRTIVSISRADYQKMHEAEIQNRLLQKSLDEVLDEMDQHNTVFAWQELERFQSRQEDLQRSLGQYNQDLNRIEMEYGQRLVDQQQEYLQILQSSHSSLREELNDRLEMQNQVFCDILASEQADRAHQIQNLQTQLQEEIANRGQLLEVTANWLQSSNLMADFLQNNYLIPAHLQTAFNQANQALTFAASNLAAGAAEASLAQAQNAYQLYSTLRIQLDQEELASMQLRSAVVGELLKFSRLLDDSSAVPAIDLQGNELSQTIDIDWWCQGEYSQLRMEVNENLSVLQDPTQEVQDAVLDEILNHTLPRWVDSLDEMILHARQLVLGSQLRINIADVVIQALEDEGFALQQGDYQHSDMRTAYHARVSNLAGNEVIIHVLPTIENPTQNELHLENKDQAWISETELKQRAVEVASALNRRGLDVAPFQIIDSESSAPTAIATDPVPEPVRVAEKRSSYQVQNHR